MYNKTCEYCGKKFKSPCKTRRFCCISCTSMYRKKRTIERNEAMAAKLGITVEELRLKVMREKYARVANERKKLIGNAPKSYAEIKAANMKNPIVVGWRGAPVLGGGRRTGMIPALG